MGKEGSGEGRFPGWYVDDESALQQDTQLVHGGISPDHRTGAIQKPIYETTTYVQESVEEYMRLGYSYSRVSNPTVEALEKKITLIERGYGSTCFCSGMAATSTLLSCLLEPGDVCIMTEATYGGTNRIARDHFSRYGIIFDFIDLRDLSAIRSSMDKHGKKVKLLFSEVPANPTLRFCDVDAISKMCTDRGILHCCDSTFATPILMRPLEHGCDLALHSTTKLFDGHNMGIGGAIVCSTEALHKKMVFWRNVLGNIMTPHVAFHTLQTMKTLKARVMQQSENALIIALHLKQHDYVEKVVYPGLHDTVEHEYACKLYGDVGMFGNMLWFEPKGDLESARKFMNNVKRPWTLCENLGTTESLITCPAIFTHSNMRAQDRHKVGITDTMVRVSVGLEDSQDLINALDLALKAI